MVAGRAPEALWLLEHDPVITTGRRPVEQLPDVGIDVVRTERGGLATWHGPGQLVGYFIVDVARRGLGVKRTIHGVEEGILQWLQEKDLPAARRSGFPGVWVGRDKVAAVGMHFRRGVSMHGFALNLTPDLSSYRHIVPCGIQDGGVTSVQQLLGESSTPKQAWESVGAHLVDTLGLDG